MFFVGAFHAVAVFIDAVRTMQTATEPAFGHGFPGMGFAVFVTGRTFKLNIFGHELLLSFYRPPPFFIRIERDMVGCLALSE